MIDVIHVVKTRSLASDGRVIKWITSLREADLQSEIVVLEDSNQKGVICFDGFKVHKCSLLSRSVFGKRKGYWLKVPEYTLLTLFHLSRLNSRIVVFHDVQQYLNLLIVCCFRRVSSKRIVWDLHELPHDILLRFSPTRAILGFIMRNVDAVVVPNVERKRYLQQALKSEGVRYVILNNYPDIDFVTARAQECPVDLLNFLNGAPYVLWMGVGSTARNFGYFIRAFSKKLRSTHKLVIIGSIDQNLRKELYALVGESAVYERFVPQTELIRYVDNAEFSVVLYANSSPNNWLCEPNRWYQLVTRAVPVICGNNPTLVSLVNEAGAGIVLPDDGSNVDSLVSGISEMVLNQVEQKKLAQDAVKRLNLCWENQFSTNIVPVIRKLAVSGGVPVE